MTQERMPANGKCFAEPEIILPNGAPGATLALWRAIFARRPRRTRPAMVEIFGVLLLGAALVVIAVVILIALLAYFVVWLCFVGVLFVGTVIVDLVHQWWHRARRIGALDHRAMGYPSH